MRIKKKQAFLYFFLAFVLISSGLAYAAVAKNVWHPKKAVAKTAPVFDSNAAEKADAADEPVTLTTKDGGVQAQENAQSAGSADDAADNAKTTAPGADDSTSKTADEYMVHKNISTTYFWAGEEADKDNGDISNLPSAWDDDWTKHFGGIDDPEHRSGYLPAKFTPKENPFYFALPYNDFDSKGNQKNDSEALAIWNKPKDGDSMCKNQWIKITKGGKTAYAQWEDVGPFGEDDKAYVFGGATPKSKENSHAGLDVSPAVHDYLGLGDVDKTDWQFVAASDVPDGPWKKIITTSQVFWK